MLRALLFVVFGLTACLANAAGLRCGNRVVSAGDRDMQVSARCGDPFWVETWRGVVVVGRDSPLQTQREVDWQLWYYNFGPDQLMRRMVFRDGVLKDIETLGAGVREIGTNCRANQDFRGMSSGELVARCGAPASRRTLAGSVVQRPQPGIEQWREQRREEWTYDFGPDRLQRIVHLLDGMVQDVDTLRR